MVKPYYLLDTNMVSEIMKPNPDKNVISKISEYEKLIALPSTVWTELMFGVNTMPDGKRKDFIFSKLVDDIQAAYEIIQYDNHAAWIQADIRSRLQENGTPVDFPDTQIASIAISNGMILVTRNTKHFEPIKEISTLMVENWFED